MEYLGYPGWIVRLLQRWHLRFTRLGRLLRRRGINQAAYVRHFPIVEVEAQLARCHQCTYQPLCDRAVASSRRRSRYTFCPNTPFIDRYLLARRRRG
jgi:hypothetical protein